MPPPPEPPVQKPKDVEEFERQLSLAQQGLAQAQAVVAARFMKGEGCPQNYGAAFRWAEESADQGNADGQVVLGALYRCGEGVEADHSKAFALYSQAAAQGSKIGQFCLGVAYENGYGVAEDLVQAKKWFQKADEQGVPNAKEAIERVSELLSEIEKKAESKESWWKQKKQRSKAQ